MNASLMQQTEERVRHTRLKKVRKRSRRLGRVLFAVGLTGTVLGLLLAISSWLLQNPKLRLIGMSYLLGALILLAAWAIRERLHQIMKRKYLKH